MEIAPDVTEGLLLPGNAYTLSPPSLVRTLGKLLVEAGGSIVAQWVGKIVPQGGAGFLLKGGGWYADGYGSSGSS